MAGAPTIPFTRVLVPWILNFEVHDASIKLESLLDKAFAL